MNKKNKLIISGIAIGVFSIGLFYGFNSSGNKSSEKENITMCTYSAGIATYLESASLEDLDNLNEFIKLKANDTITVKASSVEEVSTEVITESSEKKLYNYYTINDEGFYSTLEYEYQDYLWKMCEKYDICGSYELLLAQMYSESSYNPSIVSNTNDYGLMQINICNHEWLSEQLGISDFLNPYSSIEAGCYMMSVYLHKYDAEASLVAYNMGESVVKKGTYSSSYSRRVLENKNMKNGLHC